MSSDSKDPSEQQKIARVTRARLSFADNEQQENILTDRDRVDPLSSDTVELKSRWEALAQKAADRLNISLAEFEVLLNDQLKGKSLVIESSATDVVRNRHYGKLKPLNSDSLSFFFRSIRGDSGLSQRNASDALSLSRRTMETLESSDTNPRMKTIIETADKFGYQVLFTYEPIK